ncbi:MAG: hypothetical protein K6G75_06470 [Lachnospiraceae bacterium]|nr:hypothetical protein [Lachnospiraceae bacterium]
MIGEVLRALDVANTVIDVAPSVISAGVTAASIGMNLASDLLGDTHVRKVLEVEKDDIYLKDALQYYDLLNNINSSDFAVKKERLMKV